MSKAIITEQHLHDIADAIIAKGGATAPMTPEQMPAAIQAIPIGVGVEEKDVNFFIHDGTLVKSYTADEFLGLTDFQAQPEIEGMTAQGWNYNFDAAKDYVAKCGHLDIGATYKTDNGETRLHIEIDSINLTQPLSFYRTGGTGVSVDWGDGSVNTYTHSSAETVLHEYQDPGRYIIRIRPNDGAILRFGSSAGRVLKEFNFRLRKVEIGDDVVISTYTFQNSFNLESISIPRENVISSGSVFQYCVALRIIIAPMAANNSFSIGPYCYSLKRIILPSDLLVLNPIQEAGIKSICIPSGIANIPAQCFYGSRNLRRVYFYNGANITKAQIFRSCISLKSVELSEETTTIYDLTFETCGSIERIVIPASVVSIGAAVFRNAIAISVLDFRLSVQVPSLADKNSFDGMNDFYSIVVPDALYDEWIAATNWSDASIVGHIVKASEYTEA